MNDFTVPNELKAHKQWVLWAYEVRHGNATKVLKQLNGYNAASNDPTTWMTYDDVEEYANIGFVFSAADPYCGLDLDNSLDAQGNLKPWAFEIVNTMNSYTEISPSGKGVKIFARGKVPRNRIFKIANDTAEGEKQSQLEMFDHGKFFSVTGRMLGTQTTIRDCQPELDALYARYDAEYQTRRETKVKKPTPTAPITSTAPAPRQPLSLSDQEIIDKAGAAKNGYKFQTLWDGNAGSYGDDKSAADQALCCYLAFWTGNDASRIDSLFRSSGLYRDKWERTDYRDRTIANAIAQTTKTYTPPSEDERSGQIEAAFSLTAAKETEDITPIEKIMAETPPPPPQPPKVKYRVWSMSEMCGDKAIIQPPPIIDGILRRGEVMNLVAGAKSRKSWAILDAAISISQGSLWMGRFQCTKSTVLLIDNELRLPTLKHRSEAVCDAKGVTPDDNIKILPVRGLKYDLRDVPAYIREVKPDVVILDALYRFFPDKFDENSNADMTKLYNELDVIATQTGVAMIIVHHASKGIQNLKSVTDVGAGAGAQSRAADAHLVIRPTKADGDSTTEEVANLDIVARNFPPTGRTQIKWQYPLWKVMDGPCDAVKSESDLLAEFVERYYRIEPETATAVMTRAESGGLSTRKFDEQRKNALTAGLIVLEKDPANGSKKLYRKVATAADADKPF